MKLTERITMVLQAIGLDIKTTKSEVGTVADLTTTDKANLVVAINELKAHSSAIEIYEGDTPPPSPTLKMTWLDTSNGKFYYRYANNGNPVWVNWGDSSVIQANSTSKLTIGTTAPTDSGEYLWVETDGNGAFIDLHVGVNP